MAEDLSLGIVAPVPFQGKQAAVLLLKLEQEVPVRHPQHVVDVVHHRTEGQDFHIHPFRHGAEDGRIDQIVDGRIEHQAAIAGFLIHVVDFPGVNLPFHAFFSAR